jgi:hypothetical protein
MTMPVTLRQAQGDKVIYQGDKRECHGAPICHDVPNCHGELVEP